MLDKMQLFGKNNESPPTLRPGLSTVRRPGELSASAPQTDTASVRPVEKEKVIDKPETRSDLEPAGSRLIVGPDIKLKGAEISDCGTLVVEGRVEAVLDSLALQIAQPGVFAGKVVVDVAEIRGHFEGDLLARKKLVVHATGQVTGKIRYGKIVIEEGGEVSGDVHSLASEKAAPAEDGRKLELAGFDAARPRAATQK